MVVTGSRLEAVRYKRAADEYILAHGYADLRTLVAFSGTLVDPDDPTQEELTEVKMNGGKISEKRLPEEFKKLEYGILIAADKYQTGFDQPLLHTMYVDKRLPEVPGEDQEVPGLLQGLPTRQVGPHGGHALCQGMTLVVPPQPANDRL